MLKVTHQNRSAIGPKGTGPMIHELTIRNVSTQKSGDSQESPLFVTSKWLRCCGPPELCWGGMILRKIPFYPDVRAAVAFETAEAPRSHDAASLSGNILRILRASSAVVKGFRISDTHGFNMSALINSPL